ncbi:hypothetical protein L9F63_003057, partial [Diploptera punctata]
ISQIPTHSFTTDAIVRLMDHVRNYAHYVRRFTSGLIVYSLFYRIWYWNVGAVHEIQNCL